MKRGVEDGHQNAIARVSTILQKCIRVSFGASGFRRVGESITNNDDRFSLKGVFLKGLVYSE